MKSIQNNDNYLFEFGMHMILIQMAHNVFISNSI